LEPPLEVRGLEFLGVDGIASLFPLVEDDPLLCVEPLVAVDLTDCHSVEAPELAVSKSESEFKLAKESLLVLPLAEFLGEFKLAKIPAPAPDPLLEPLFLLFILEVSDGGPGRFLGIAKLTPNIKINPKITRLTLRVVVLACMVVWIICLLSAIFLFLVY